MTTIESAVVKFSFNDPALISDGMYMETKEGLSQLVIMPEVRVVIEPHRIAANDLPAFFRDTYGFRVVSGLYNSRENRAYVARFVFAATNDHDRGLRHLIGIDEAFQLLVEGRTWEVRAEANDTRLWIKCVKPEPVRSRVHA
ncbi:MAG TPA: hypothetical protein PK109_00850 [Candidatus Paceibacterota bacterium]|nr:hypothetical protein [Candidatus Paceibacterota bacterium]